MKDAFISKLLIVVTAIAQSLDTGMPLTEAFYKRGYGSGGANEITDGDLVASGLTVPQLISGIVLLEQLAAMRAGQAVAVGDYGATLATLRRDI
jgi:hypothetical protein